MSDLMIFASDAYSLRSVNKKICQQGLKLFCERYGVCFDTFSSRGITESEFVKAFGDQYYPNLTLQAARLRHERENR